MEGNGGAKRPAFVVSPTPPPPRPLAEGDEEEQMEKFYALLENIKAMRGLWRTNPANKRPRREEPLWQPRFVREDFNDRNEDSGIPVGESHSSKDGERKKGKEKEQGGEEGSTVDLSLSL
uniref:NRR repressor homolog 1 n=1 Tax=Elaeis guineensis var. tenera TaxID=51953 RepID=A0A6I9R8E4_ELAGV|nr:NRR repressor homolog 1 [Elaeis guineensis]